MKEFHPYICYLICLISYNADYICSVTFQLIAYSGSNWEVVRLKFWFKTDLSLCLGEKKNNQKKPEREYIGDQGQFSNSQRTTYSLILFWNPNGSGLEVVMAFLGVEYFFFRLIQWHSLAQSRTSEREGGVISRKVCIVVGEQVSGKDSEIPFWKLKAYQD